MRPIGLSQAEGIKRGSPNTVQRTRRYTHTIHTTHTLIHVSRSLTTERQSDYSFVYIFNNTHLFVFASSTCSLGGSRAPLHYIY
jgi:hypothetical protein